MIPQDLIDRLAEHKTLGAVSRTELAWLVAHGTLRRLNAGEVLSVKGAQVEALYIILSGRLALFVDRGAGPTKIAEWSEGDVTGMLPYSRLVAPPGDSRAVEPVEILVVYRGCFREMTRECFEITTLLVHTMIDRARLFTSSELQNEKMISLGKLSAGLAHELNNPASAIERCAALLEDRIEYSEDAARGLAAATLGDAQIAAIDAVRTSCMAKRKGGARSALDHLDREEAIAAWLANHGLDTANAALLADTEVTFESLDQLVASIERPALNSIIRWAAAGRAVRNLASNIQDSAMRISSLVIAAKGFTHMDQANVADIVDLEPSLSNTVAVLTSR